LRSLEMLYRSKVLGHTLAELALRYGTTPNAICKRQQRALRRLRRRWAAMTIAQRTSADAQRTAA
jgi:hypothetical protein